MILSECTCDHRGRMFATDASRNDPTGARPIATRWEQQAVRRWRAIERLIRHAVVDLDVLGKRPGLKDSDIILQMRDIGKYEFGHSPSAVKSFASWLDQQVKAGVLGVEEGTAMKAAASTSWQNVYIDSAYQKGIRDAYVRLDQPAGRTAITAAFNSPVHADKVAAIYTRSFEELAGVTDAVAKSIREELAIGFAEGLGPNRIAAELVDRVESIGIVRARTIARTEVTAAHATATLNSYREARIEGVSVQAEFSTAGDDQVCPECEDLEGKVYDIDEADGMIPVHPNCRCAFIPVVE